MAFIGYCDVVEETQYLLEKAARFKPPYDAATPQELFTHHASEHDVKAGCHQNAHRMVRRSDPENELLIYTDGSCLGQHDAVNVARRRAGYAFVFKPKPYHSARRGLSFRLENHGPTEMPAIPTSNRAKLRAVIGALQYRRWDEEGFRKITIATNSEYVVLGITDWIEMWIYQGWRNCSKNVVLNRDLWELLLDLVNVWAERGVEVRFWRIGRELNTETDGAAKAAASSEEVVWFSERS